MLKKISFFVVFLFLFVPTNQSLAQTEQKDIDLIWGVKIPMRDGVKLNAMVYKPKEMKEPLPVIFTLTPYISDTYHPRACTSRKTVMFSRLLIAADVEAAKESLSHLQTKRAMVTILSSGLQNRIGQTEK
jgi:hypothetical protein